MLEQLKKYIAFVFMILLVVIVAALYVKHRSYESQLAELRNQLASKDKTTEEQTGEFTKLTMENDSLKSSNAQLQNTLDKTKQVLISEQQVTVELRAQLSMFVKCGSVNGVYDPSGKTCSVTTVTQSTTVGQQQQTTVQREPPAPDCPILKYDSGWLDKSFVKARCDVIASKNPEFNITLDNGSNPLTLLVDLSRDKDKQWHSHVVSNDSFISVNVGINQVNIDALEEHWYERLKVHADLGGGVSGGILGGIGVGYEFGKFDVGPMIWGTTSGNVFGGLSVSWTPFKSQ